jgi:monofunctional biosynthetic peptidoglycan transglycosylase
MVKGTFKLLFFLIFLAFLAVAVNVVSYFIYPDVSKLRKKNPGKTNLMLYMEEKSRTRGGKLMISQDWVPLQGISVSLREAVLIAEDDKFWHHEGFDFEALQRALEEDIKNKKFKSGGSTITQQLAKNLYLTPSKNPLRKLKEAVLAWRLERSLSKARILEIYLNVAQWGENIFGVETASRHYYGKRASELTPWESARLASVLPNPKKYSPTGNSRYVKNRSRIIYNIMSRRGVVPARYAPDPL